MYQKAKKRRTSLCTDSLKPSILLQIQQLKLTPAAQEEMWAEAKTQEDLCDSMIAAATAAARIICDAGKDSIFLKRGIKVKRLPKTVPPPPLVARLVPVLQEYVQTHFRLAQTPNASLCRGEETGDAASVPTPLNKETEKPQRMESVGQTLWLPISARAER